MFGSLSLFYDVKWDNFLAVDECDHDHSHDHGHSHSHSHRQAKKAEEPQQGQPSSSLGHDVHAARETAAKASRASEEVDNMLRVSPTEPYVLSVLQYLRMDYDEAGFDVWGFRLGHLPVKASYCMDIKNVCSKY